MTQKSPLPSDTLLIIMIITGLMTSSFAKTSKPLANLALPPKLDLSITERLRDHPDAMSLASRDYGNMVHRKPAAVFYPSSIYDILRLVKFSYNSSTPFAIAARGNGHSIYGQAMASNGVVVDMGSLRKHRNGGGIVVSGDRLTGFYADVSGEQLWIDVLEATLEHGVAPVSWTDYLYLTIGGTLSNAGISGTTFRYGPQISNVDELDVITGKGDIVTCSTRENSELFLSVLGGLGQFGIITRARIPLQPAAKRVKWVRLLYNNFSDFTRDQEHLISNHATMDENDGFQYLEGLVLIHQGPPDSWRSSFFPLSDHSRIISLISRHRIIYCLELAKFYEDDDIHVQESEEMVKGLSYIPEFYFEKSVGYVEFLNRVRSGEVKLESEGLWDVPHPWLNLFVPKSGISEFNAGVLMDIVLKRNITTGPILMYPMNRSKWDERMSAVIPEEEEVFYAVGFLHSSGFDEWEAFDSQNREILQFCENAGIKVKQYLPHYKTQQDWAKHFGNKKWKIFREMKSRFEPRAILSPGQAIFNSS